MNLILRPIALWSTTGENNSLMLLFLQYNSNFCPKPLILVISNRSRHPVNHNVSLHKFHCTICSGACYYFLLSEILRIYLQRPHLCMRPHLTRLALILQNLYGPLHLVLD